MELLVVRLVSEVVEAPEVIATLIVWPKLLNVLDKGVHRKARPAPVAVRPEEFVEFGDDFLKKAQIHRLAERRMTLEHPVPERLSRSS